MCLRTKKIPRVGLRPSVEIGAGGEELEELHDPPIAQAHPFGANLEDEPLVGREKLLAEAHSLREGAMELADLARGRERLDRGLPEGLHLVRAPALEAIL